MFVADEALGLLILILDKAWQSHDTDRDGRTPGGLLSAYR